MSIAPIILPQARSKKPSTNRRKTLLFSSTLSEYGAVAGWRRFQHVSVDITVRDSHSLRGTIGCLRNLFIGIASLAPVEPRGRRRYYEKTNADFARCKLSHAHSFTVANDRQPKDGLKGGFRMHKQGFAGCICNSHQWVYYVPNSPSTDRCFLPCRRNRYADF